MEGIVTQYDPEDREAELRQEAEQGRRAKIALEVLEEFLTRRHDDIVCLLEDGSYSYSKNTETLRDALSELRILRLIRDNAEYYIRRGKFAEEVMSNGD